MASVGALRTFGAPAPLTLVVRQKDMAAFPLIRDLPTVLDTIGWDWRPFSAPYAPSINFWLGTDPQGHRWLTKLRGSFYAYREIVFSRLAQQMGWSCQSTVFMRIDEKSAKLLGVVPGEIHAAHWFLDEHINENCSNDCALKPLIEGDSLTINDLASFAIPHILDLPKCELAAHLFGANDSPDSFFTSRHAFVAIDSEQMFSTGPCSFYESAWIKGAETNTSRGIMLAKELCADLLSIGIKSVENALSIPNGITVHEDWPIAPLLRESYAFAHDFIKGAP